MVRLSVLPPCSKCPCARRGLSGDMLVRSAAEAEAEAEGLRRACWVGKSEPERALEGRVEKCA